MEHQGLLLQRDGPTRLAEGPAACHSCPDVDLGHGRVARQQPRTARLGFGKAGPQFFLKIKIRTLSVPSDERRTLRQTAPSMSSKSAMRPEHELVDT